MIRNNSSLEIDELGKEGHQGDLDTWNENLLADVAWQDQLAKYSSVGMGDNDVVREHKTYVRKVHMMKSLTRKFIKLFEYFLT